MNEFEIEEVKKFEPEREDEEEVKNFEPEETNENNGKVEQLQLPPYPDCILFDVTEEQAKIFKYTGDEKDLVNRMRFKLFLVWQIWAKARNNSTVIEIINAIKDKESNEFVLGNELVCLIDAIGRTLSSTYLTEELFR